MTTGGVVLIAVMADRLFGFEVGPRQWAGLALTAAGLVLLAVTLPAAHGAHSAFNTPAMVGFEAGLFFLGGPLYDTVGTVYNPALSGVANMRASSAKVMVGNAAIKKNTPPTLTWP